MPAYRQAGALGFLIEGGNENGETKKG